VSGFEQVDRVGDWSKRGTQGYFAAFNDFALLAFRGTEADDPLDSLADLDLLPAREPDYRAAPDEPHVALRHLSIIDELLAPRCLVHRGFQQSLNCVWEEVHGVVSSYRASHPRAPICFTGHSLGAALATLAFSRFDDLDHLLYTFGCPRVGNAHFGERLADSAGRMFRYVNLNDPVAHVPVADLEYQHVPPRCLRIDENGNVDEDLGDFRGDVSALRVALAGLPRAGVLTSPNESAPEGLVDHSPARYCIRLWNCV
jgi:hypothetical protein